MVIFVHFIIAKASEIFKNSPVLTVGDNEDLRLKLKRACGKFLSFKGTAFVNPDKHIGPLAPS